MSWAKDLNNMIAVIADCTMVCGVVARAWRNFPGLVKNPNVASPATEEALFAALDASIIVDQHQRWRHLPRWSACTVSFSQAWRMVQRCIPVNI
jgi:hypothetical protein